MTCILIFATLAVSTCAAVVHKEPVLPDGWTYTTFKHSSITFRISLKQRNLDQLTRTARRVSDPTDSMYGKYLTQQQIEVMTAPPPSAVQTAVAWATSINGCSTSTTREVIIVECSKPAAESLLGTVCYEVRNDLTTQTAVRCSDYTLPEEVHEVTQCMYGLHGLPLPSKPPVVAHSLDTSAAVTPDVIATTYKVSGVTPSGSEKNRQAVAEFQGQTMNNTDLSKFWEQFVPQAKPEQRRVFKFVGDPGEGHGKTEANLDVQYIMGVAPGVLTEFWYIEPMDFCGDLKTWTHMIMATDDPPLVHSVSYGWQASITTLTGCLMANVNDVDAEFVKLAARGITIVFASGDWGAGYSPNVSPMHLYPSWPASSPWVTSVGATRFVGQTVGHGEMAADQIGSGGGFSDMFDAFDEQKEFINNYFSIAPQLPPSGSFPKGGRGTPDVSGLGEGYQVMIQGQPMSVAGTSASAPMFAALVSLLNEARIAEGMPAMGYINPWLYKNADAFTDVTRGDNFRFLSLPQPYGFNCTAGWDPVTGIGTPLFDKMLSAATKSNAVVV